jgi:hypothetical protein
MRQPIKHNRFARILRRLLRSEGGSGDILSGVIMTGAGLLAVSQTLPPLRDAFNTAGDALKNQAGVLARGSNTGSTNTPSMGGGASGFDLGSVTSGISQGASAFGNAGNSYASGGSFGSNSSQSASGKTGSTGNVGSGTIRP